MILLEIINKALDLIGRAFALAERSKSAPVTVDEPQDPTAAHRGTVSGVAAEQSSRATQRAEQAKRVR
jgi:hypothetical protein